MDAGLPQHLEADTEHSRKRGLLEAARSILHQNWIYPIHDIARCLYISDVDGNGTPEILLGTDSGRIKMFDWRAQTLTEISAFENERITCLAAADIDTDGTVEILVATNRGTVCALKVDGRRLWNTNVGQWVDSIYLLTAENPKECFISVGTEDGMLYFLDRFGIAIQQVSTQHTVLKMPAYDPVRPAKGLFIGGRDGTVCLVDEVGRECWGRSTDGWIYQLHLACLAEDRVLLLTGLQNGDLIAWDLKGRLIWERSLGNWVHGVSSADIDGDGQVEIVAATRIGHIHILDINDGKSVWRWHLKCEIVTMTYAALPDEVGQIIVATKDGQLVSLGVTGLRKGILAEIEELAQQPDARLDNLDRELLDSLNIAVSSVEIARPLQYTLLEALSKEPDQLSEGTAAGLLDWVATTPLVQLWSRQVPAKIDTIHWLIDPDGYSGLVVGAVDGSVSLWGSDGKLRWRWLTIPGNWVWAVSAADLNDDGCSELVVGTKGRKLHILDRKGKSLTWHELPQGIRSLILADVDGDGRTDFVLGCEDSVLYVLDRSGDLKWEFVAGGWIRSIAVADLDGDGRLEVIAGARDGVAYVLGSNGQPRWQYDTANWVRVVCPCDIDGDGHTELVLGCDNGTIYALRDDRSVYWTFDTSYRIEAIRPLEVDGQVQLLVGSESQMLHSLTADGKLAWTCETMGWVRDILVADVDNDDQAEVILSVFSSGSAQASRSYLQVWKILDRKRRDWLANLCERARKSTRNL